MNMFKTLYLFWFNFQFHVEKNEVPGSTLTLLYLGTKKTTWLGKYVNNLDLSSGKNSWRQKYSRLFYFTHVETTSGSFHSKV